MSTITRPGRHLVSTIAVFAVLIACVVLSVIYPQMMWLFGIVGALPVALWYVTMMKTYRVRKAEWLAAQQPHPTS